MEPSSTVCLPTKFERIDYLLELLDSILNQTKLPNKILFITNPGKIEKNIKLKNIIKKKINNLIEYEFIESSKIGLANARNVGIENCKTDIIIFGDDDDIWHPDKIKKTISLIAKQGKCIVRHYHSTLLGNVKKEMHYKYIPKPNVFMTGISNFIGGGSSLSGSLCVFQTLRFKDYKFCEDWDFWLRALLSEVKIIQINKDLVTYRIHSERMTGSWFANFCYETKIRFKILSRLVLFLFGLINGFILSFLRINYLLSLKIFKMLLG